MGYWDGDSDFERCGYRRTLDHPQCGAAAVRFYRWQDADEPVFGRCADHAIWLRHSPDELSWEEAVAAAVHRA